ncbi:MAG: hypothetical protein ACRENA_11785 [Vulcanimicrobiaceae bacterium]
MTFFVDNCLPPQLVAALKALDESVCHLKDVYPASVDDVDYIPEVAAKGWIIVTSDLAMRKRGSPQAAALKSAKAIAFFMPKGFASLPFWDQAWKLFKMWPTIRETAARAKPSDIYDVTVAGKVERKKIR